MEMSSPVEAPHVPLAPEPSPPRSPRPSETDSTPAPAAPVPETSADDEVAQAEQRLRDSRRRKLEEAIARTKAQLALRESALSSRPSLVCSSGSSESPEPPTPVDSPLRTPDTLNWNLSNLVDAVCLGGSPVAGNTLTDGLSCSKQTFRVYAGFSTLSRSSRSARSHAQRDPLLQESSVVPWAYKLRRVWGASAAPARYVHRWKHSALSLRMLLVFVRRLLAISLRRILKAICRNRESFSRIMVCHSRASSSSSLPTAASMY